RLDEMAGRLKEGARKQAELLQRVTDMQRADDELALKKLELSNLRAELRATRNELQDVSFENAELVQERDAARREAALHQLLARQAPVIATPAPADDRDPTEIRFSLLELGDEKG